MKNEFLLWMYDTLIGGQVVERKLFCAENKISERTFYRYMRAISVFLIRHKSDLVVDVREPMGEYYIKKSNG